MKLKKGSCWGVQASSIVKQPSPRQTKQLIGGIELKSRKLVHMPSSHSNQA